MTDDFLLDHRCKGYPLHAAPCRPADLGQRGWNVLAGDLPLPIAVIRESALAHNLAWMQAYAERKGVALAPHGKTTLSPELFAEQLQAGAWGLTFATVYQLSVGVEAGARRAIIANQVLCDADLDGLHALLQRVVLCAQDCVQAAGVKPHELTAIYLTGGSSALMPFQRALQAAFLGTPLVE
eukprot:gene28800-50689_t